MTTCFSFTLSADVIAPPCAVGAYRSAAFGSGFRAACQQRENRKHRKKQCNPFLHLKVSFSSRRTSGNFITKGQCLFINLYLCVGKKHGIHSAFTYDGLHYIVVILFRQLKFDDFLFLINIFVNVVQLRMSVLSILHNCFLHFCRAFLLKRRVRFGFYAILFV